LSKKTKQDTAIKIKSIQANSLYRVNNGYENAFLDCGKAVINNSLFSEYMRRHGVTVNRKCESYDFVSVKFDYGVKAEKGLLGIKAKSLRKYYYTNGADIVKKSKNPEEIPKTISYKMLMRSTGKAKEGDCIFIREDLHKKALQYITMDLWDKMPYDNAKIVEMSAYSTLITATAIDYIVLPLDNIFVVEDEKVTAMKKAVTVKDRDVFYKKWEIDYEKTEAYINEFGFTFYKKKQKMNPELKYIKKSKKELELKGIKIDECPLKEVSYTKRECYVDRDNEQSEVRNVLWDGMGLIDESIFPESMEGFIYCRSHFFKSCLFRGNLQQYFKNYYGEDYSCAVETDMFGRKMKVTDIKIIITENSLKWIKFIDLMGGTLSKAFDYYEKFMKKHGERFSIVKTAHSSKWGELQRSSYQMNGSLPTTDENILKNIAKESIDYCNRLKLSHAAFMDHLRITGSKYSINNVLIALNEWNDQFKYTQFFKDKKTDIISRFKKERLQLGKLLQYGDNLTICGNPIALLMKVTGQDFLKEPCFKPIEEGIQCYSSRFKDGEKLAGFRSPHNSPNNIVYLENVYSDSIKRYFSHLGSNVIIINGIYTDVQQRLNGQDLDSDAAYVTNQKDIVELAKMAYKEYPTIINGISVLENSEYKKSMESYARMDSNISSSQYAIGWSSNIAQLALSYYYHDGGKNQELENVFIICSVLAQVAIDSAKRNFNIKVNPELSRISNLDCMKRDPQYPRFYADIQKLKQRKSKKKRAVIEKKEIGDFNCPMDIIYRIIENGVIDLRKYKYLSTTTVNLRMVFDYNMEKIKDRDRKQHIKVISIVEEYDGKIKTFDKEDKDYHEKVKREFELCMLKLNRISIKENTMYSLIAYAFYSGGSICDRLLIALYEKDSIMFLNCFKKSTKSPHKVEKSAYLQGFSKSTYEEGHERNVS